MPVSNIHHSTTQGPKILNILSGVFFETLGAWQQRLLSIKSKRLRRSFYPNKFDTKNTDKDPKDIFDKKKKKSQQLKRVKNVHHISGLSGE